MPDPTRWTASYLLRWTPILTFERRRLSLLDWIEEHLEPVAFNKEEGRIGIAVGSPAQRLIVHDGGLTVQLRSRQAEIGALTTAIEGVLEILEPRRFLSSWHAMAMSVELTMTYEDARRGLASRAAVGLSADLGDPFDCSNLLDLYVGGRHATVEYGIVSASELRTRLSDPSMGRITGEQLRPSVSPLDVVDPPGSSLFVDISAHTHAGSVLAQSATGIIEDFTVVEEWAAALVAALQQGL